MNTLENIINFFKPVTTCMILSMYLLSCGQKAKVEQEKRPDYTSTFPQYKFPSALEEQEEALETNPLMFRFSESRKNLSGDPHRPIYHFVNPEGYLNDPNGLSFWQGNWHLFYQTRLTWNEDARWHWGHAISKDLIHWRDLPLAIYPNPEMHSFSGSALVEEDRVIVHYHGVRVGNMIAISDDPLLLNWEKLTGEPVIPMKDMNTVILDGVALPHHVYDPFLWKDDGIYYSISGWRHMDKTIGRFIPTAELYQSTDLENWEYVHQLIEGDRFTVVGTDAACPYFLPIGDRYIYLFFSHYMGYGGAQYWLGDYNKNLKKFTPTSHGYFNYGPILPGGVHAPSATSDGKGGVITIFNINEGKPLSEAWTQLMSLPMRLTLKEKDELGIEPAGDIESLRYNHQSVDRMILPANREIVFDNVKGNAMEIMVEIDPKNSQHIELNVLRSPNREEYTRIIFYKNRPYFDSNSTLSIDTDNSSILPDIRSRPTETAPLHLEENENLQLRVFIDKSVLEVYANGKQYAAVRVYPGLEESIGVSIRSRGQESELISLDAWQMNNIWDLSLEEWYVKSIWR